MMGDWQAFLSSRKAKTKQLGFEKVSVSLIVKDCAMYLIKEKREKQNKIATHKKWKRLNLSTTATLERVETVF